MINRHKHQLIMGRILKDIYTDVDIGPFLGFKGGTCAFLFYGLTRFSVDLDFDLLLFDKEKQELVYKKILKILGKYGRIKDSKLKHFTIFALLSYGNDDHNIKIEINTRKLVDNIKDNYELKKYLGITMFVAKKDYMFAGKLIALTSRNRIAMRDVYDIHYFAINGWDINIRDIEKMSSKSVKVYLKDCIRFIEGIKDSQVMSGLGELIDVKQKTWIKDNLKSDTIFLLKNYTSVIK